MLDHPSPDLFRLTSAVLRSSLWVIKKGADVSENNQPKHSPVPVTDDVTSLFVQDTTVLTGLNKLPCLHPNSLFQCEVCDLILGRCCN